MNTALQPWSLGTNTPCATATGVQEVPSPIRPPGAQVSKPDRTGDSDTATGDKMTEATCIQLLGQRRPLLSHPVPGSGSVNAAPLAASLHGAPGCRARPVGPAWCLL